MSVGKKLVVSFGLVGKLMVALHVWYNVQYNVLYVDRVPCTRQVAL